MTGTGVLVFKERARIVAGGVVPAPEERAKGAQRIGNLEALPHRYYSTAITSTRGPHVLANKIEEVAR